jgi:hypothetical protein
MEGFDDELSMLNFVKSNNMLKGSPVALYLEGYEDVKFRMSNFKEKLQEDPKLKEHFYAVAEGLLKESIQSSSKLLTSDATIEEDSAEVAE